MEDCEEIRNNMVRLGRTLLEFHKEKKQEEGKLLKVKLTWEKVIKAEDFDSNTDFLKNNGGLYLWIWPGENPRVGYVGETLNFYNRMYEHFCNIISGQYLSFNPSPESDFLDYLKEHYVEKTIEELNEDDSMFCPYLNANRDISFSRVFLNENELKLRLENLRKREFAFATVVFSKKTDKGAPLRKQIEGALINELFNKYKTLTDSRLKLKKAGKFCQCVLGDISKWPETDLEIVHEGLTDKIPQEVIEITSFKV